MTMMLRWQHVFGELAAIALQNSRNQDERIAAEEQREKLIKELQKTVKDIKTLKGIIPICMHCKGIRDDQGSWKQLEKYISEHSDAQFSHGICQKCTEKYYPDMDLFDN